MLPSQPIVFPSTGDKLPEKPQFFEGHTAFHAFDQRESNRPDPFTEFVADQLRTVMANREKLCRAWAAETGIPPSDSIIVEQRCEDGTTRVWIERKEPYAMLPTDGDAVAAQLAEDRLLFGLSCEITTSLGARMRVPPRSVKWNSGSGQFSVTYDPEERALEKQASRDEDARRLAAGEVTPEQLREENTLICPEGGRIVWPDDGPDHWDRAFRSSLTDPEEIPDSADTPALGLGEFEEELDRYRPKDDP
jgi:hypothetical protein